MLSNLGREYLYSWLFIYNNDVDTWYTWRVMMRCIREVVVDTLGMFKGKNAHKNYIESYDSSGWMDERGMCTMINIIFLF